MKIACAYYRRCSGCTKLQFPYVKQVHDKALMAREALTRFVDQGEAEHVFLPLIPSPLPLGYRSSTKLCLHMDTFGQRSIGLYERGTKKVVDIPQCPVHHSDINRLVAKLFAGNAPVPAPFYQHGKRGFQAGCLKFVTVRVSPATKEAGIVVSHTGVEEKALADWAQSVARPGLSIYASRLTAGDDDRILSSDIRHLAGPAEFSYPIAGTDFHLTPLAFFQANLSLTDAFVEHIVGDLAAGTLVDLYGGFGAYSFAARSRVDKCIVVDGNEQAIAAANATAKRLNETRVRAVYDSVETFLAKSLGRDAAVVKHVIVNPPRGGLSPKVREQIKRSAFPQLTSLTYVSCNLETLARDLGGLISKTGLRVASIQSFDMFPQTDHLEVVVKLRI